MRFLLVKAAQAAVSVLFADKLDAAALDYFEARRAGMAIAGACHAEKSARVFAERRWKSNDVWMARTGYASAAATCAIAQHPCDRPQVLPAYGLQDLRNEEQNQKTKSNPNTMSLRITPGGNRGTGHFYLAKNRTFLLCVDTN